jgi:hypothetical protein
MTLATLLRELATLYRRYGDVPVVIETPTHILHIDRVDDDIWNVDENVSVVIETEQADNPNPNLSPHTKKRPNRSQKAQAAIK